MKANDLRRGMVLMYNNIPHRVIEFHHHTPGNLRAMVQTKLRNLLSGTQTEVRFGSTEEIVEADIQTCPASYLYSDGEGYHFLNSQTYEQFYLTAEVLGDGVYYLQDEMAVTVTFYEGQAIGIELPSTVVLTVTETEPELRGATASNSPKPAKTNTGITVTVPPFIKVGDKIVVNTEEGKYISRAD